MQGVNFSEIQSYFHDPVIDENGLFKQCFFGKIMAGFCYKNSKKIEQSIGLSFKGIPNGFCNYFNVELLNISDKIVTIFPTALNLTGKPQIYFSYGLLNTKKDNISEPFQIDPKMKVNFRISILNFNNLKIKKLDSRENKISLKIDEDILKAELTLKGAKWKKSTGPKPTINGIEINPYLLCINDDNALVRIPENPQRVSRQIKVSKANAVIPKYSARVFELNNNVAQQLNLINEIKEYFHNLELINGKFTQTFFNKIRACVFSEAQSTPGLSFKGNLNGLSCKIDIEFTNISNQVVDLSLTTENLKESPQIEIKSEMELTGKLTPGATVLTTISILGSSNLKRSQFKALENHLDLKIDEDHLHALLKPKWAKWRKTHGSLTTTLNGTEINPHLTLSTYINSLTVEKKNEPPLSEHSEVMNLSPRQLEPVSREEKNEPPIPEYVILSPRHSISEIDDAPNQADRIAKNFFSLANVTCSLGNSLVTSFPAKNIEWVDIEDPSSSIIPLRSDQQLNLAIKNICNKRLSIIVKTETYHKPGVPSSVLVGLDFDKDDLVTEIFFEVFPGKTRHVNFLLADQCTSFYTPVFLGLKIGKTTGMVRILPVEKTFEILQEHTSTLKKRPLEALAEEQSIFTPGPKKKRQL